MYVSAGLVTFLIWMWVFSGNEDRNHLSLDDYLDNPKITSWIKEQKNQKINKISHNIISLIIVVVLLTLIFRVFF